LFPSIQEKAHYHIYGNLVPSSALPSGVKSTNMEVRLTGGQATKCMMAALTAGVGFSLFRAHYFAIDPGQGFITLGVCSSLQPPIPYLTHLYTTPQSYPFPPQLCPLSNPTHLHTFPVPYSILPTPTHSLSPIQSYPPPHIPLPLSNPTHPYTSPVSYPIPNPTHMYTTPYPLPDPGRRVVQL